MRASLPPEVERGANGLRVRGHDLVLDPRGRPPLGFVAHARGAPRVLPERMVCTAQTLALLTAAQPAALKKSAALPAAPGKPFALGNLRLTVYPAGHVLGSAQLRVEGEGLDLVWAADLGGSSLTAEPRAQLETETLALHALYGHPRYLFPPREQLLQRVLEFIQRTLHAKQLPVLIASPIGATQDVLRFLDGKHLARLHPSAYRASEIYGNLTGYAKLEEQGDLMIVPPTFRLAKLPENARICALTGRALDGVPKGAHEAIPLSDHAGYDVLLDYALNSQAHRVLVTGGHADELVLALRNRGLDASAVREQKQLELF